MNKHVIYIILLAIVSILWFFSYTLKPTEHIKGDTEYIEKKLTLDDSLSIVSEATKGLWKGTHEEAMEEFGKRVYKTFRIDSLVVDSIAVYDTSMVAVPYLTSLDTLGFSGNQIVDEDSVSYALSMRLNTTAYFEPINQIKHKAHLDSLKILIIRQPEPEPLIVQWAIKYKARLGTIAVIVIILWEAIR